MQTPTPKQALRAISIFFYTMIAGLLMFAAIVFTLNLLWLPALTDKSFEQLFLVAALFIAVISTMMATRLYKKRIAEIQLQSLTLMDKLELYRASLILYVALCEG